MHVITIEINVLKACHNYWQVRLSNCENAISVKKMEINYVLMHLIILISTASQSNQYPIFGYLPSHSTNTVSPPRFQ